MCSTSLSNEPLELARQECKMNEPNKAVLPIGINCNDPEFDTNNERSLPS